MKFKSANYVKQQPKNEHSISLRYFLLIFSLKNVNIGEVKLWI